MPNAMMMTRASVGGGSPGSGFNTLTIDHTKCGSNPSTDWPLLVTGTIANLKSIANGGLLNSANNVAFYSDAGKTTLLKFERGIHDLTTGFIEYYVKIPTLSNTTDTVIYPDIDPARVVDLSDVANTWNSAYKVAYHFGTSTSLVLTDVIAGLTLSNTNTVTPTSGIGGGGADFNGTNQHLDNVADAALRLPTNFTVELWFRPQSGGSTFKTILAKTNGSTTANYILQIDNTLKPRVLLTQGAGNYKIVTAASTVTNNVTYHLAGTYNGTTLTFYLNGASSGTPLAVSGSADDPNNTLMVGSEGAANFTKGMIDEIRLSNVARSADYLLATYNNGINAATFYTIT